MTPRNYTRKTPIRRHRKPRKNIGVVMPTSDTGPELRMRFALLRAKFDIGNFVTNEPFQTKFVPWLYYPDIRYLTFPLIIEVNGIIFHSGAKKIKKDTARAECLVGMGYYVYVVTDTDVNEHMEKVIKDLALYIGVIRDEQYGTPRVRVFSPG